MHALWDLGGHSGGAWLQSHSPLRLDAEVVLKAEQPRTILSNLLPHVPVDQLPLLLEDSLAERWSVRRPRAVPWHAVDVLRAPIGEHLCFRDERLLQVEGAGPVLCWSRPVSEGTSEGEWS